MGLFCSFCNKSEKQVQKLIAGPNLYICGECVIAFTHPLVSAPKTEDSGERCSFCGNKRSKVFEMIQINKNKICTECLKTCVGIINNVPTTVFV